MCDRECGKEKQAPIHPQQLMTERLVCPQCNGDGAKDKDKELCKCYSCGLGTEGFIRGSLLEIFAKSQDYPLVLIEKVKCPGLENSPNFQEFIHSDAVRDDDQFVLFDDGKPENDSGKIKDIYVKKEHDQIEVYHVFDQSLYYDKNHKGECSKEREEPSFKAGCTQADLHAAKDVMDGNLPESRFKKIKGITQPGYSYDCKRRPDCPLIELAFPIPVDGKNVAVLIIGQIKPQKTDCSPLPVESETLNNIAKCMDEFIHRMEERVDQRRTVFFYRFLKKLYGSLADSIDTAEETAQRIKDIYQQVDGSFDYHEMAVFYSDGASKEGYSYIHFPENPEYSLPFAPEELLPAVNTDIGGAQLRKLFQAESDPKVGLFCQHAPIPNSDEDSPLQCFILTHVKWKQDEDDCLDIFFDSLNARLFSLLMTQLAKEKQKEADEQKMNQDTLIATFSHDLNQKLEIVDMHTKILDRKKENWGLEADSGILNDIRDYIKDIQNHQMLLKHFTQEVRDNSSGLPTKTDLHSFFPYSAFLFNLKEYYDTKNTLRLLYMPTSTSIANNSPYYPYMTADPVLIERCVNNLLSNAHKYSYRYTNIYLDCYKEKGNYFLEVTNFSPPIQDDVKDRMFEMGVSQSLLRNYKSPKGKGYGLAIVKKICDLHEGTVVPILDENISAYNVPVLNRLINSLSPEPEKRKEQLTRLRITEEEYRQISEEHDRLLGIPVDKDINYAATVNRKRNALQEICVPFTNDSERLTAPYLRMALFKPTVRVRFRITLPQP